MSPSSQEPPKSRRRAKEKREPRVRHERSNDDFGLRAADRSPEQQEEHRRAEKVRVAKREELTDAYTPQQRALDKRLREWRKAEAATNGRPAFYVLTDARSEEHTSELQSLRHLVCRLLLE